MVDDEASITRTMRLYLEKTGNYEVREVNDSSSAVATARQFKPDLILLDIIMPDTDGGDVAAEIQSIPELKDTPIVFLTATVSRREVGNEGIMVGGRPLLAKPVNPKAVIERIEKILA